MVNYQRYIRLAKRFFWVIALTTAVCGIGSYFISSYFIVPQYQVTSTVLAYKIDEGKQELYYGNILANEKMIGTFRDIASSRRTLDRARKSINLNMSLGELSSKVSIHIPSNSQILSISVKDPNYKQAISIANALAAAFQTEIRSILPDQHVVIIDLAQDIGPMSPISPNLKLNAVLGGFLGAVTSGFILLLFEFLRATIRSKEEAQIAADSPVLVTIGKIKS